MLIAGYMPHIAMPKPQETRHVPRRHRGRPRGELRGIFGELEVLERTSDAPNGRTRWRCRCLRCGSICDMKAEALTDERFPRTCGCARRKAAPDWWVMYG